MILSFGWTYEALLAGVKDTTRRDWSASTLKAMQRCFDEGRTVDAWNATPRVVSHNPHKIAVLRLVARPERSDEYPADDYQREGLAWLAERGRRMPPRRPTDTDRMRSPEGLWAYWTRHRPNLVVVRFAVETYLEGPLAVAA